MSQQDEAEEVEPIVKPSSEPESNVMPNSEQDSTQPKISTSNTSFYENPCSWTDNFCCKTEPETVLQKMYKHFAFHHEAALRTLNELKDDQILFDKFEACTDIYTLFQILTFMYTENLQFKAIVDEFNTQYEQTGKIEDSKEAEERQKVDAPSPIICRIPIDPVTKCTLPKNEPPYTNRDPNCDSRHCVDRPPLDDPLMEYCANPDCSGQKKLGVCRGFLNDSDDSIIEAKEKPKPFHEYFDCFLDEQCKDSSCYPCNLTTNQTRIKRYVVKYLQAIESGNIDNNEEDTEQMCKCTGFRKYILDYKNQIKQDQLKDRQIEEENKRAIQNIVCPCQRCPIPEKEKDSFNCIETCTPCAPEVEVNLCVVDCKKMTEDENSETPNDEDTNKPEDTSTPDQTS